MCRTGRLLIAACIALAFAVSNLIGAKQEVPRFNTNKREFNLPVQLTPGEAAKSKEIRLYVTSDLGKNWKKIASGAPTTKEFSFTAPKDGIYSFAVHCVCNDENEGSAVPVQFDPQLVVEVVNSDQEGKDVTEKR
jgi:hypothetical protein